MILAERTKFESKFLLIVISILYEYIFLFFCRTASTKQLRFNCGKEYLTLKYFAM